MVREVQMYDLFEKVMIYLRKLMSNKFFLSILTLLNWLFTIDDDELLLWYG